MEFVSKIYNYRNNSNYVIPYLSDDDLYKFTMQQFVLHRCPASTTKIKFKCRSDVALGKYADEISKEIDHICDLRFEPWELDFFRKQPFFTDDYVDFLEDFKLKRRYIKVSDDNGELKIVAKGPWLQVILFEVKVLKIVEEVYNRNEHPNESYSTGRDNLKAKIVLIQNAVAEGLPFKFADFGTRRCFSGIWQEEVVAILARVFTPDVFLGTSNVMLAAMYGIRCIGTMAHELFQAGQALGPRLIDSQQYIMQEWANEYRGSLGIALSDTLGIDKFLKDFDPYFAKLFDGLRHDSGDPIDWAIKVTARYKQFGIDPATKNYVFSDGLDIPTAIDICQTMLGISNRVSFGIGTNLTNDVGHKALQIVMKMVECNGQPVAKVSDNPAKTMCDDKGFIEYLSSVVDAHLMKGFEREYLKLIEEVRDSIFGE